MNNVLLVHPPALIIIGLRVLSKFAHAFNSIYIVVHGCVYFIIHIHSIIKQEFHVISLKLKINIL